MFSRVKEKANEKLASLAERVDERIDRFALPAAAGAAGSASRPPRSPAQEDERKRPPPPTPLDPAAAKAFESVPKQELIALLAKTNSRCRSLETRYAELQALHSALLEEKRQLIASRGRSAKSAANGEGSGGLDQEAIERQVKSRYDDRLAELEEAVESSTAIKKALQTEAARSASALAEAEAALKEAQNRADAANAEAEAAKSASREHERAAAEAARALESVREAAKREEAVLVERLMSTQHELAAARAGGGNGASGGGGADGWEQVRGELQRFYDAKAANAAEAAAAAAAAAAARERQLNDAFDAAKREAEDLRDEARRWESKAEEAAKATKAVEEELVAKDKALARALSNYREEVLKWGNRMQTLEATRAEELAKAEAREEALRAELDIKLAEAEASAEAALRAERSRHNEAMEAAMADAASETQVWRERLELAERRGQAEAAEAERGRADAGAEWRARLEEERLTSRDRLLAAENEALEAKHAAARLESERDELASRLDLVQKELLRKAEHSSAVQSKASSYIASASEHEALVRKLEQQLQESEREYRSAKALRASLEAELSSARDQLKASRSREEAAARDRQKERAEAEELLAAARAQAEAAEGATAKAERIAEVLKGKLDAVHKQKAEAEKSHATAMKKRNERVAELEAQLDSGKPSEAAMFNIARDQAKRDAETDKLRSQIKSLRQMLKESHRVLTHLMQQEGLLKEELANTRRDLERQEGLNVAYLKNITVAFLLAIYGDADDDEHIRLARVLATILKFSPEEVQRLNTKIAEYSDSWWHRTSNLLKADPHAPLGASSLTEAYETLTAIPATLSEWFWGTSSGVTTGAPAAVGVQQSDSQAPSTSTAGA